MASALPVGDSCTRDGRARLAVQAGGEVVVLAADLDARHIPQPHGRAIGIGAQHDRAEFLRRGQLTLDQHGGRDLLRDRIGLRADSAGGDLSILRLNGRHDVVGRQVEAHHLVRIDPDTHRALCREQLRAADAVDPADLTNDVAVEVIAEPYVVEGTVRRPQRNDQQERSACSIRVPAASRPRQPGLDAADAVWTFD